LHKLENKLNLNYKLVLENWNDYHYYVVVIANIQDISSGMSLYFIFHTLSEGNVCVKFLVKLDSSNDDNLSIYESSPYKLKELISVGILNVAYPIT
jgi:hypothetical protein